MQTVGVHTVTGTPAGGPAHAARPPLRTAWWLAVLAVAAGATVAAASLSQGGHATSTPGSAQSITVTRTATDTAVRHP